MFLLQIPATASTKQLTSCSSTPWVMNAWDMMSIHFLYVYYYYVYYYVYCLFCFEIADFQYFLADTICSCIEAVDELFKDTLG